MKHKWPQLVELKGLGDCSAQPFTAEMEEWKAEWELTHPRWLSP